MYNKIELPEQKSFFKKFILYGHHFIIITERRE
jgi:hypothetical protein